MGPRSRTVVEFLWEDACTAPNSKVKQLHNLGMQSRTHIHDERIAQLQQHSSSTAATERLRGVASDHTKVKVDRSDASLKKDCKMHLAHHLKRQL